MDYIYTILFLIIIILSIIEIFFIKHRIIYYFIVIILIILCGFRYHVGPDYQSYKEIFFSIKNYNNIHIESLFYYINFIYKQYNEGYVYVFFSIALLSILLKSIVIYKYSYYPILSILLYYTTCYFSGDSGQIRQNIAISICFFSTIYIIKNNLFLFLFLILLASGFHNTAIIFLLALPLSI